MTPPLLLTATVVVLVLVILVLVLVGDAAAGTSGVADEHQPWVWLVVILLIVATVVIEVRRQRSRGRAQGGHSTHNQISGTVYGSVVQAGTITLPVADASGLALRDRLAEAADQLAQAVGSRWQREEEQRQVQDPFPLPVRWRAAPETLTDHWANISRVPAGVASRPLALSGQLDGLVEVYRRIPSGRLVVLGRSGSGKTILTLRFVLDLLNTRGPADAVPVIFSLGSWDPTKTSLREWVTRQLVRDYPGLVATSPVGHSLAAELVEADRILPVLDGFDEIADGLHRAALKALNATTLPLVLTTRPAEYAAAVAATDVLTSAAGIELIDLTLADLVNYLPRTTRKEARDSTTSATVWEPVLDELRDRPQSESSVNLSAVLSTPLMVALARIVYSDTPDHDPAVMLDTNRFRTAEALEDHLLGNFIPAAYHYKPGGRRAGSHRRWDPERAEQWLSYLARHLDRLGTRDLAWWQLGNTTRRASRILLAWISSGLAFGVVDGLVLGLVVGFEPGNGLKLGLANGLVVGVAFGLAHGCITKFGDRTFEPSRVRMQILYAPGTIRERFVPRFMLALAGGLGGGLALELMDKLIGGLALELMGGVAGGGLVSSLVFGLVVGLGFGLMAALESPIDIRSAVSPIGLLNTNRTTVVVQLLVFGLVVGLGGGLLVGLGSRFVDGLVFGLVVGLGVGSEAVSV
ncbi:NACHT domain-containing protein [Lentzea indica]|uniref:NACHT domain-containing protein n=1 Tax=Lentzea indica TaxID=2604800 RepID=UPI001CB71E32|nr:NACHT domain-containing protein [Lentzea indica]